MKADLIEKAYTVAKERYAAIGVSTDEVFTRLAKPKVSVALLPDGGCSQEDMDFVNSLVGGKGVIEPGETSVGEIAAATERLRKSIQDETSGDIRFKRLWASVIVARMEQRSELEALLRPEQKLREYEDNGQYFECLALMEEAKSMPLGAVFDYFNLKSNVPVGEEYIAAIRQYVKDAASKRS